ncbi:MAG: translation initiation factor IF-3 [Ezakiella coagulans]|uniref:translation initiation factor IF-3 n=1 Tax=Ezakiella coagulans TaxID=46507 RepID=UPI000510630B|nr:translation initiation factor IF-3 [Ezakiella coagulans]KGF07217.1 translation initiation factor IF-3 [Tissierellia bacterium S7-1-4]UQK61671.1 translation initiation factor IF-3 [Ezakiella coagulans]
MKELEINGEIRDQQVRLIDAEGNQLGIVETEKAMEIAENSNLDLVKVAPQAKPPVCKIMDYGKYRYELQKKDKEAKKNQKTIRVKEIKMSPTIEEHDLKVKTSQAVKFLEGGDKVKVSVRFRGRQMGHVEQGKEVLNWFFDEIKDYAQIDKPAKLEGRNMVMYVLPKSE